jgi:hypothetical protein
MSSLLDPRGCLTPAGLAAVERAPVGQAPPELAQHLAACARCQARLLGAGRAGSVRAPEGQPTSALTSGRLLRTVAMILAALLLAVTALVVLSLLRPGGS